MQTNDRVPPYVVVPAEVRDIDSLPGIERRAASIFSKEVLPPEVAKHVSLVDDLLLAQAEGRVLVARAMDGRVMGFALVESLDGHGVLEELDVDPRDGRQGIGQRLIEAACHWALGAGHSRIVLSTFRDIPWNAPFYARQGFVEIPSTAWTPALTKMRADERALGLDTNARVLMARILGNVAGSGSSSAGR